MKSQTFDKLNDWALRHDYRGYLEHCISVQYLKRAKDIFSITYIIVSRYNIYETLYLIITGARTCYETTSDTKHLRTLHLCAGVYIYIYIWMSYECVMECLTSDGVDAHRNNVTIRRHAVSHKFEWHLDRNYAGVFAWKFTAISQAPWRGNVVANMHVAYAFDLKFNWNSLSRMQF